MRTSRTFYIFAVHRPDTPPKLPLQGFLQSRGDIRASIVPRDFRVLPTDAQDAVDTYFHREELEGRADRDRDEDQDMNMDTEVAVMLDNYR